MPLTIDNGGFSIISELVKKFIVHLQRERTQPGNQNTYYAGDTSNRLLAQPQPNVANSVEFIFD